MNDLRDLINNDTVQCMHAYGCMVTMLCEGVYVVTLCVCTSSSNTISTL